MAALAQARKALKTELDKFMFVDWPECMGKPHEDRMLKNTVVFDGAGEEKLASNISQAWNADTLDDNQRRANDETLRNLVNIINKYPQIRCKVHGETGAAISAPKPLADYLKLHEVEDVAECMDFLARRRAEACVAKLYAMGVPSRNLFATWDGMGGHIRVTFEAEGDVETPEEAPAPMLPPPPEPLLHRDYRRTTIVSEGPRHLPPRHSRGMRNRVIPWAARDLKEALRKFPSLDSAEALKLWLHHISRDSSGGARFDAFVRAFCDNPPMHNGEPYTGDSPTTLADQLHFDCARISKLGVCGPNKARALAEEIETLRRIVTSDARRSGNDTSLCGTLMPQWLFAILCSAGGVGERLMVTDPEHDDGAKPPHVMPWRSGQPQIVGDRSLPPWGEYRHPSLHHHWRGCDPPDHTPPHVQLCPREPPAPRRPIEWPKIQVVDPNMLREARSRILELLETPLRFNGAGDDEAIAQRGIGQAWSIDHTDPPTRLANREVLQGISDVFDDFEHLMCEVHGETGHVNSAPLTLAAHLDKDPFGDVGEIMDELARLRTKACHDELVAYGVDPAQLKMSWKGQGGKLQRELRFGHVPLRFVKVADLRIESWKTLHLAINCHFDPLPDEYCAHDTPCRHRVGARCDQPNKVGSVRSWEGKQADYALSSPAVPPPNTYGALYGGGGPRGAYDDGVRSAFFSSTRTPNPHVGDARLGPLGWKTSLLWAETRRHAAAGLLLWSDACCLDQEAISRGLAGAERYAESVLAALEECDFIWVHTSSDYSDSLFTVLELCAWHVMKTIHPSNTRLLNAMAVTSVSGRSARLPLYDPKRDHVAWVRAQLRKHGSIGREYAAAFKSLLGVDVRDEGLVRTAFAALAAIAATPDSAGIETRPEARPPKGLQPTLTSVGPANSFPTWYNPEGHTRRCGLDDAGGRTPAPEIADYDYGWLEPPGGGGSTNPPKHYPGGHPPYSGRIPDSLHHPGPRQPRQYAPLIDRHLQNGGRKSFLKPGMASDVQARTRRVAGAETSLD